jgi:hypothetical protein
MKQSACKSHSLSLVPPVADESAPHQETSAASLKDYFDGWLNSVAPSVLSTGAALENRAPETSFGWRPLTSTDVTRVNRATVRESTDHRHWPPGVVEKFIEADVIKGRRK